MAKIQLFDAVPFKAVESTLDGKRNVRLIVQDFRQKPKVINLIVHHALPGFSRLPVAWEFIDAPLGRITDIRGPRHTSIRIVAGPGVSIHLESWPTVSVSGTLLDVYRVQDPEIIPPQASTIYSQHFAPTYEIGMSGVFPDPSVEVLPWQYRLDYFTVEPMATGTLIKHPHSTYSLAIEYPSMTTALYDTSNADSRFCYQVRTGLGQSFLEQMIVSNFGTPAICRVVKTPSVKVTLRGGPARIRASELGYKQTQFMIPFEVYEASDIERVPPPGSDLEVQSDWKDRTSSTVVDRDFLDDDAYFAARTFVSFLPVVGLIVDLAEFVLVMDTGKDFRGIEIGELEKSLMILGIFVDIGPFSPLALLRMFGRKIRDAIRLRNAIKAAGITPAERTIIKEAVEKLKKGAELTKQQVEVVTDVVKKLPDEPSSVEMLLNAEETGFTQVKLQEEFQANKIAETNVENAASSPRESIVAPTRESYRKTLMQINLLRAAGVARQRIQNVADIMSPIGYTNERLSSDLLYLLSHHVELSERLRPLMADLQSLDPIVAHLATRQVPMGRLGNIKGVIGELFALPTQLKILAERHSDSLLFTGIKIKLKKNARTSLFADNIIVTWDGKDMQVKRVFEVKATRDGGADATEQIHHWITDRLHHGDEIIIPANSKYYDASGAELKVEKEIRLKFGIRLSEEERAAGFGLIMDLESADRTMIVSNGTSELGLDSKYTVPVNVERLDLPLTSHEFDYLSARWLMSLRPKSPD
ncbi:hypothetical protein DL98DRAFT_542176 [Cadophora sp. DSE1049]|nr:hypothetical protein DL98DRAFT_542176 [Cadophora sp. DSE1049]